jgi:DNA polymerase-3 subunit epsilon
MPNKFSTFDSFCEMIDEGNFVVLDTETTGLGDNAEMVDLAIVAPTGEVLFDQLIKPSISIENGAAQAHGISNEMVQGAISWKDIQPTIFEMIRGVNVVTYGATFDRRIFHQSDRGNGLPQIDYCQFSNWCCCMEAFADLYGEINPRFGTKTWKKLVVAAEYFELGEFTAHRALADAEMTRRVARNMCQLWRVDKSMEQG